MCVCSKLIWNCAKTTLLLFASVVLITWKSPSICVLQEILRLGGTKKTSKAFCRCLENAFKLTIGTAICYCFPFFTYAPKNTIKTRDGHVLVHGLKSQNICIYLPFKFRVHWLDSTLITFIWIQSVSWIEIAVCIQYSSTRYRWSWIQHYILIAFRFPKIHLFNFRKSFIISSQQFIVFIIFQGTRISYLRTRYWGEYLAPKRSIVGFRMGNFIIYTFDFI